jgi:hypothetical protein
MTTSHPLSIPNKLWAQMITDLKQRGEGRRESGAFLLGPIDGMIVTEYICYDDLDPNSLDTGIIEFEDIGFSKLWPYCIKKQVRVFADAHTHPTANTRQSGLDKDNPMIVEIGHLALIIPNYAQNKNQLLQGVGVYRYLGSKEWDTQTPSKNFVKLIEETYYEKIIRYCKQIISYIGRKRRH